MKDLIFKSETVQDTEKFADSIASLIKKNDLILLKGELGSGKTTLARSIINSKYFANDINHIVPSPTFSLLQTYEFGNRKIGHADLYRIQNKEEITVLEAVLSWIKGTDLRNNSFGVDGKKHQVLARDLQLHPVTDRALHIDFMRFNENTRIVM